MEKRTCAVCGVEETPKAGGWLRKWFGCPECDTQICDSCAEKKREEDKKLREMRNTPLLDPTKRITAVCPSCAQDLRHMG